jgi:acyl carrier protein
VVSSLAVQLLDVSADQLAEDVAFVDDLGVDSLALIEFAMAVEDALGISLPEEELATVTQLGPFVDLATLKVSAR